MINHGTCNLVDRHNDGPKGCTSFKILRHWRFFPANPAGRAGKLITALRLFSIRDDNCDIDELAFFPLVYRSSVLIFQNKFENCPCIVFNNVHEPVINNNELQLI